MVTEGERQAIVDEEQLRILPIGYWVSGGFWGAYTLFMAAYFMLIGTFFSAIPTEAGDGPPPQIGWVFLGIGAILLVVFGALAALRIMTGFWIRGRRHRVVTMIVAAIGCLEFPYGTMLGVFTFIVLARPSVKALYGEIGYSGESQVPTAAPAVAAETESHGEGGT